MLEKSQCHEISTSIQRPFAELCSRIRVRASRHGQAMIPGQSSAEGIFLSFSHSRSHSLSLTRFSHSFSHSISSSLVLTLVLTFFLSPDQMFAYQKHRWQNIRVFMNESHFANRINGNARPSRDLSWKLCRSQFQGVNRTHAVKHNDKYN